MILASYTDYYESQTKILDKFRDFCFTKRTSSKIVCESRKTNLGVSKKLKKNIDYWGYSCCYHRMLQFCKLQIKIHTCPENNC